MAVLLFRKILLDKYLMIEETDLQEELGIVVEPEYTYTLEEKPAEAIAASESPVSREEFNELKKSVEALLSQLT